MSETEPETVEVVVTCHTATCPSEGRAIPLTTYANVSGVVCGACGNPITDVAPPLAFLAES